MTAGEFSWWCHGMGESVKENMIMLRKEVSGMYCRVIVAL